MPTTFKPVVYADNKRQDGTYNVKIRVTHRRQTLKLSTNMYVAAHQMTRALKLKDQSINTWKNGVERALKKYVVDGTEAKGQVCPVCGHESLVFQEGCLICKNCGASRCG